MTAFPLTTDFDGGAEEVLKRIDAINLILPNQMLPPVKVTELDTPLSTSPSSSTQVHENTTLRGYQTLQELREKVSTFRQGYLNWRKFKPHGARGEGTDIMTGRKVHRSDSVSISLLLAMDAMTETLGAFGTGLAERTLSVVAELPELKKQVTTAADSSEILTDFLEPGLSVAAPKKVDEEEAWLRFYFNPFTPAGGKKVEILEAKNLGLLGSAMGKNLMIPQYNRDPQTITDWILHIGVGQFHRSHQLVYMDDLLGLQYETAISEKEQSSSKASISIKTLEVESKWGYCGIGLMPFDLKMADALRTQDHLYTVLSRGNASSSARVIGSMFDYVFAPDESDRAFKRLVDPRVRIISLTITEKGYCQSANGQLDTLLELIKGDIQLLKSKGWPRSCPKTAIGFLYLGLRQRREESLPPFTVMSCDNLPENGHVARRMVLEFANCLDPEMSDWISKNVAFPATMVDRITPSTVLEHREILAMDFGVADRWPVVTEDYRQWVIEDNFPTGRPKWEAVSALMCKDVRPFELMKLRLLNGGHSMLGYISYLAGHRGYMDEVTSTIRNVSVELERYKEKIVERFGNRMMKDLLLRICEDGSTKFYNTVKDPLLELIEEDRHIQWSSLGIAAWIVFLAKTDSETIKDGHKDKIMKLAKICLENPRNLKNAETFLRSVFGELLGSSPKFISHVSLAVFTLNHYSVETVLKCGGILETIFHDHLMDGDRVATILDFALNKSQQMSGNNE